MLLQVEAGQEVAEEIPEVDQGDRQGEEPAPPQWPDAKGKKAWIIVLLVLLAVSWYIQSERIQNLESRLVRAESYLETRLNDMSNLIGSLQNSAEEQNSLISDWRYEVVESDRLGQAVLMDFYLTPKSFTEDLQIELNISDAEENGGESVQVPLVQEGYVFAAEGVSLPLSDRISVSAVFDYGAEKQLLNLDPITNLKSGSVPCLQPNWSGTAGTYYDEYRGNCLGMEFDGQVQTEFTIPRSINLTAGAVEFLVNDTVVETFDMDVTGTNGLDAASTASVTFTTVQEIQAKIPCTDGDRVSARVAVTDDLGIQYSREFCGFLYTYADGIVDVENDPMWLYMETEVTFPTA